jgi:hypothetical protein
MGRHASEGGNGSFEQPPVGTYAARCVRLIDLGTQHGEYEGKATVRNQVLVSWELPTELMQNGEFSGKPFMVSRFYTNSLGEKANLRKDLEAWRGRAFNGEELDGFDLMNILGKACMLSLIHDRDRTKVSGVMALPKGMSVPEAINPLLSFWIEEWDDGVFNGLSNGVKEIIMKSDEYKARAKNAPKSAVQSLATMAEDIPF